MSSTLSPVTNTSMEWDTEDTTDGSRNYTLTLDSQITSSIFLLFNLPCGFLGNGAICWFVYNSNSLRTPTGLLICNLAVAGLIQSLICAPLLLFFTLVYTGSIVQEASSHGDRITGVGVVCYIQAFLRYVSGNVILFTTMCIAQERHHAIAKPFDKLARSKRVKVTIPLTWIGGLVLGLIGTLVFFDTMEYALCHHSVPDSSFGIDAQYGTFFTVPIGLLSVVLIVYHYTAMLWLVRKHLMSFKGNSIFSRSNKNKVKPITKDLQQSQLNKTCTKEEIKSVKVKEKGENVILKTDSSNPQHTKDNFISRNIAPATIRFQEDEPNKGLCELLPGTTDVQDNSISKTYPRDNLLTEAADQLESAGTVLQDSSQHQFHRENQAKNVINGSHLKQSINVGSSSNLEDGRCLETHSISQGNNCLPHSDKLVQSAVGDDSPDVKISQGESRVISRHTITRQSLGGEGKYISKIDIKYSSQEDSKSILRLSSLSGYNRENKNAREMAGEKEQGLIIKHSKRPSSSYVYKKAEIPYFSGCFSDSDLKGHGSSHKDSARSKDSSHLINPCYGVSTSTAVPSHTSPSNVMHYPTPDKPNTETEKLTRKDSMLKSCETNKVLPEVETTDVINSKQTMMSEKDDSLETIEPINKENSSQASEGFDRNDTSKLVSSPKKMTADISNDKPPSVGLVDVYDIEGNIARQKASDIGKQEVVGAVCAFNPKNREKGRRKVEAHTAKMTALAMICFLLCWIPYPTAILVVYVDFKSVGFVSEFLFNFYSVSVSLSILASAINPLIYGLLNTQFKSEFQKVSNNLKKKIKCKR